MQILSVISQKGGVGKTTTALLLAVSAETHGIPTAIIDTDAQGSATKWFERREASSPQVTREMDPDGLPRLAEAARRNGIGLLIIDTPGKAESMALAACDLAGLVVVPVQPAQLDLETLGAVKRTLRIAERLDRAWVVLNRCPSNSRKIIEAAETAIAGYGLRLAPPSLHARADFAYAMTTGQTASEYEPAGKAAAEAAALFDWVRARIPLTAQTGAQHG